MNATTGFFISLATYAADCCSATPPISPISTTASVPGSSLNMRSACTCVVPITGSPPTPTHVLCPTPRSVNCATASYTSVPDREMTPTFPFENTFPGMIPTRASPGVITPGQFGPITVRSDPFRKRRTRTMSIVGTPSVMQMITGISAYAASSTASAANGAGTKISAQFASVFATASATVSNTGTPSASSPPRPGVTPATTFVPYSIHRRVWKEPSFPVIPCTSKRV